MKEVANIINFLVDRHKKGTEKLERIQKETGLSEERIFELYFSGMKEKEIIEKYQIKVVN